MPCRNAALSWLQFHKPFQMTQVLQHFLANLYREILLDYAFQTFWLLIADRSERQVNRFFRHIHVQHRARLTSAVAKLRTSFEPSSSAQSTGIPSSKYNHATLEKFWWEKLRFFLGGRGVVWTNVFVTYCHFMGFNEIGSFCQILLSMIDQKW